MILSPKQIESFNESTAKINIWEGSVRSGKTYISLWRFLDEIKNGPPGHFVAIAKTVGSFKRNVYNQLVEIVGPDVHWYSGKQEMFIWGRQIHIIGASDERSEAKIKGATFSGGYVDEATEIPESAWKMLISRCAKGAAKIFATTNPDTPFHYLKTEFLENNPDVRSWKFLLEDNPSLTNEDRQYLMRQYKGLWHKRFILAEWCLAEGSIYDIFDEDTHVFEESRAYAKYYVLGVDYGTTNPCAFVLVGFNDDSPTPLWVEKEYYFSSKDAGYQKTDAEYANDLLNFIYEYPVKTIYIDPSAASFKLEVKRALNTYGKQGVTLLDAINDVQNGICVVAKHLALGHLKIRKQCKNLIQEFQSYVWDSKKAQKGIEAPLKHNDHALDALRYALFSKWGDKTDLKEMSSEERAFEMWKKQQQQSSPWAPPPPQKRPMQFIRPK
jgi:PBSX family phage terminase large subunit